MYIYATVGSQRVYQRLTFQSFLVNALDALIYRRDVCSHVRIDRIALEARTVSPDDTRRLFAIIEELDHFQGFALKLVGRPSTDGLAKNRISVELV